MDDLIDTPKEPNTPTQQDVYNQYASKDALAYCKLLDAFNKSLYANSVARDAHIRVTNNQLLADWPVTNIRIMYNGQHNRHVVSTLNSSESTRKDNTYNIGDIVVWSGQGPCIARVTGIHAGRPSLYMLSCPNYDSCSPRYLRKATQGEIRGLGSKDYLPYENFKI